MKSNTSIFDIKKIDDLPEDLVRELKLSSDSAQVVLLLFKEAGGVLNLSELLAGYYRKYKEVKTRNYMMVTCYRLCKKGFLSTTKHKGEYKITSLGMSVALKRIEK